METEEKKVKRDVARTIEALSKWCAKRMPEREAVRVSALEVPQKTGFSSETLMFQVEWKEKGELHQEKMVARLKPSGSFNLFPKYDVELEYRVMKDLAATDVPVPPMLGYEPDRSVIGDEFYVMGFVKGRIPTDSPPYHLAGWVPELAPAERTELWWSGFDAMARVHKLDWQKLDLGYLDQAKAGEPRLEQLLRYWQDFHTWGLLGRRQPACDRAEKWLWHNRPSVEEAGVVWGDARLANQIFDGLKCVAVIDWEMARIGNPEDDLAWWIWMDRCFSEGLNAERLPGFPSRAETVARWEQLTGHTVRHLEYYEMLAGYRFSLLMARLGMGMKAAGSLPQESDFDMNNFAHQLLAKMVKELD